MSDPYAHSPLWGPTVNIHGLETYTFGYKVRVTSQVGAIRPNVAARTPCWKKTLQSRTDSSALKGCIMKRV